MSLPGIAKLPVSWSLIALCWKNLELASESGKGQGLWLFKKSCPKCSGLVHWEDPEESGGEGGGSGGWGWGIHVTPWLIHVNVWQNPLQCGKVISLQLIKINLKKAVQKSVDIWKQTGTGEPGSIPSVEDLSPLLLATSGLGGGSASLWAIIFSFLQWLEFKFRIMLNVFSPHSLHPDI